MMMTVLPCANVLETTRDPNTVTEIQDSTHPEQWRFVLGDLNPADECTGGLRASEMTSNCRWIAGPAFLHKTEEH